MENNKVGSIKANTTSIYFNVPPIVGTELQYISEAINNHKICGDGSFTKADSEWLENKFQAEKILLTTSGTHALEMAAILSNVQPGDEVIMPSFTFVSTADAFVQRGAKIVFVDIRPDTMNIDENLIESAITEKTKVICPVHYAGVSCNMDKIMQIARKHNLKVVEDAAQGVMASYKGKAMGTIGDYGCYSFHETKNYSMGEGGALVVNHADDVIAAEIIREKGTNRSQFFRGQVDKYTWMDYGSSYLPSELNAAYLYPQLKNAESINNHRLDLWECYYQGLEPLAKEGAIELPYIPSDCCHNAHMFYIKVKDLNERTELMNYLRNKGISTAFHYVPLHTAPAGKKFGRFHGLDRYTTKESERLLRLPMHYALTKDEVGIVIDEINKYYGR